MEITVDNTGRFINWSNFIFLGFIRIYFFSASVRGAVIACIFKQGTDPDMAAVNVQNRVTKAQGFLPAEVIQVGVITQKSELARITMSSNSSGVCNRPLYRITYWKD